MRVAGVPSAGVPIISTKAAADATAIIFLTADLLTYPAIGEVRQPGDLGVLRGVIRGFSEEARTRGFASLSFLRFAFFGCNPALCADVKIASILGYT